MIPAPDSVDFRQEPAVKPPDMITVLLLPPSYHFPEFSRWNRLVRFHLGINFVGWSIKIENEKI
jgi:hypothetical protein